MIRQTTAMTWRWIHFWNWSKIPTLTKIYWQMYVEHQQQCAIWPCSYLLHHAGKIKWVWAWPMQYCAMTLQ